MRRIVLGIQYNGSSWRGWQTQPGGGTVQDRLQEALHEFSQRELTLVCAGRTDAGVHALEQVAHFDTDLERDMFSWVRGVNAFLPPSIAVRWAADTGAPSSEAFHARFSAISRTYHYLLYNHAVRSPLFAGSAGWTFRPLDLDAMLQASRALLGEHDFSAFRSSECQAKTPVKTMHEIDIARHGDLVVFRFRANAFLHHMVRNIMGALVYVGTGVQPPAWLEQVLEQRDRGRSAPTFMPDGLYLSGVKYEDKWGLPQENFSLWRG